MPSNLNLDYYYGTEADQYSFYRIPKTLLTDPRYKSVSIEAKVLYGLLLDRMGLSVKKRLDGQREARLHLFYPGGRHGLYGLREGQDHEAVPRAG